MNGTTWEDVARSRCEARPHHREAGRSAMGRTYCFVTCPFCTTQAIAYLWSLSGGGKRCPGCGAMHGADGMSHKRVNPS